MAGKRRASDGIRVVRARENNLRNLNLTLPEHKVVALAGASGAGKSTLAHLVIASTARHRLGRLTGEGDALAPCYQPDVAAVEDLPPCIEFLQEPLRGQNRSTVATYSGLMDLLAALFLGFGERYSPGRTRVLPLNDVKLVEWICRHHANETLTVGKVRPDVTLSSENHLPRGPFLWRSSEGGWIRMSRETAKPMLPMRGSIADLEKQVSLSTRKARSGDFPLPLKDKTVWLIGDFILDAAIHSVAEDDPLPYEAPSRRLFSFNSSLPGSGRCPRCSGLGVIQGINERGLIRSARTPLVEGGLNLAQNSAGRFIHLGVLDDILRGILALNNLSPDSSWEECPKYLRNIVLNGSGSDPVPELRRGETKPRPAKRPFAGLIPLIVEKALSSGPAATAFKAWLSETKCPECGGSRLNRSARSFEWRGYRLGDLASRGSIGELAEIVGNRHQKVVGREAALLDTIQAILKGFVELNLGHLPLMRSTGSLSGGEAQRLKLGSGLALELKDVCYILDEPSRGLHFQDVAGLASAFRSLARNRNSIVVVEHHPLLLQQADHVVILGPGGGSEGGNIVYQGKPVGMNSEKPRVAVARAKPSSEPRRYIEVEDLSINNLHDVRFRIPVSRLTAVTGVSGAGKSTAIMLGLLPLVESALDGVRAPNGRLRLPPGIDFVEIVGQKLVGRNRRSVVATALDLFDPLRKHFASLSESQAIGLNAGDFSFNSSGACSGCGGSGVARDGFGNDTELRCPLCDGTRLSNTAFVPRSAGLSLIDILQMPITELASNPHPAFDESSSAIFNVLIELGLEYLTLARATSTLSAGERQRLALSRFLSKLHEDHGNGLLVLDEPTAGLSTCAAERVFKRIQQLTDCEGHTAIVIEHKLELLTQADWVLEFGPGGGPNGGLVVFEGSPEDLTKAATPTSKAWKQHNRMPVVSQRRDPRPSDEPDREMVSWKICADVFEALAIRGEVHSDSEIGGTIRPAVHLNSKRIAPDTRVGELLDLLPALRGVGKALLPPRAKACRDDDDLRIQLDGLEFGFSPVASQRRLGVSTPTDLRKAVRALLRLGFQNAALGDRNFTLSELQREALSPEEISDLLVLCPADASESMRGIALRWCQGVAQVVSRGRPTILSTRFLSRGKIGLGLIGPQVGDFRSLVGRCLQCMGGGFLPTYEWELIVADSNRTIFDDQFWAPEVLESIRSLRRTRLLPEAEFFAKQFIADFRQAPDRMDKETRMLFEHGIPWRDFPKPSSARSDREQDYYSWRGLHDYVHLGLSRIKCASYRKRLIASFKERSCPVCNGSGMGWESTQLMIKSRSLAEIWQKCPLSDWSRRVGFQSPSLQTAIELNLGKLRAGDRFSNLSPNERERLLIAASVAAPLKGLAVLTSGLETQARKKVALHGMKLTTLES